MGHNQQVPVFHHLPPELSNVPRVQNLQLLCSLDDCLNTAPPRAECTDPGGHGCAHTSPNDQEQVLRLLPNEAL